MDLLNATFLGNSLQSWSIALTAFAAVFIGLKFLKSLVIHRLRLLDQRGAAPWRELVVALFGCAKWPFFVVAALFAGSLVLELPPRVRTLIDTVTIIAVLLQGGRLAGAALDIAIDRYRRRQLEKDRSGVTTINVLSLFSKVVLWSVVLLLVLDNLGVNITALIAGLGVGGIAVALAVQAILGDLFASLSIILDKPFMVGDFLIVGEFMGSVEHIGLKTTRIRSLSGEQLVFSNSDLLGSRIRNYGRMYERRVVFTIGVTYQTPREQIIKIPQIIREAIEEQDTTRFDRSHFKEYGDFSLNFETVYYVLVADYNRYMDIQQAINLRIHERFEQEGLEFAYPTQTVYVAK